MTSPPSRVLANTPSTLTFTTGPLTLASGWAWLPASDKQQINVIMDHGLQGVSIADDIYQGGLDGMVEAAGSDANINIVGEYYGEFAEGVQEPLISAILAANPDKKIDVVFTQGYCTTVVSAFKNAGLDYTPYMYCQRLQRQCRSSAPRKTSTAS